MLPEKSIGIPARLQNAVPWKWEPDTASRMLQSLLAVLYDPSATVEVCSGSSADFVFLFSEKVFIHVPAGSQIETGGKYHGH